MAQPAEHPASTDAEALLRAARRPLVIGMGGGGDVVGALATAEHCRIYDGAEPVLGGVSWERQPIDPQPGPRAAEEIAHADEVAPGVLLAGPQTCVRASEVRFAESRMAEVLGQRTVLIDIHPGVATVAEGVAQALGQLGCDLVAFIDVGGDVLAHGDEPGLRSPLCDAMMLAVLARLHGAGTPALLGIFGLGCDAELTPAEVLDRVGRVAARGGLAGSRGLTGAVVRRVREAVDVVPTEASALAIRAFAGERGRIPIRGGQRHVELSSLAAQTIFLDVPATIEATGRLAQAVDGAHSLTEANDALHRLGVKTELDLERRAAGVGR